MSIARLFKVVTAGVIAAAAIAAPAQAQNKVGDAFFTTSSTYGSYEKGIIVAPYQFSSSVYGESVLGVSIFNGQIGRSFTPLIFESLGSGQWKITGVGTERTIAAGGQQDYAFGLTAGSNLIGSGTYLGWHEGLIGGPIGFGGPGTGVHVYSEANQPPTPTLDYVFTQEGTVPRQYNIQFTTYVPEPSTWLLTASGLLSFVGVARRRRRA